jgi:hypothetical protein
MADIGTVTVAEQTYTPVKKVTFDWTSAGAGGNAGKAQKTTISPYTGEIISVTTIPSGSAVPTAAYDVYLYAGADTSGVDVTFAQVENRSATATENVTAGLGVVAGELITLYIKDAGNAKSGRVIAYIR